MMTTTIEDTENTGCPKCGSDNTETYVSEREQNCLDCGFEFELSEEDAQELEKDAPDPSFVIARHQEGITLNDYEYILENSEIKVFNSNESAVEFLKQNGCTDEEIEFFKILKL